jgi:hypothetical protein
MVMARNALIIAGLLGLSLGTAGCIGLQTFPPAVRSGDTVALPVGWNTDLSRQTLTVTIAPSAGDPVTYEPGDPRVRAVVRLYPDPLSRLVVGTEIAQGLGVNAHTHGARLAEQITGADREWWQTTVVLDLPPALPPGPAVVTLAGPSGSITSQPLRLEILPGLGGPTALGLDPAETAELLTTLERAEHVTVTFSGPTVPYSIHAELLRTPGVGTPWVANPRGDLKNVAWSDDGTRLRVVLTPAHGRTPADLSHFRFYVAGGVTGLRVLSVKAYDITGQPIVGLSATIR